MKEEPLITVIVPVYKVEQYLSNCIESVIAQSYKNWELLLVDDGSPDHCPDICDEYAQKDKRIVVIHKQNGGLSSARNAGLDYPPRGRFVTFLDSDDFWHPDYLKSMITACLEKDADLAQCKFAYGTETSFPECDNKNQYDVYDNHSIFTRRAAVVLMCGKVYKTSLFDDVRMPIGLYNEDDWTAWKIYYKAERIAVTRDKYYYYTSNPNSIMANQRKKPDMRVLNAYEERIQFFKERKEVDLEHMSRWQVCKFLILTYSHESHTKEDREQIIILFRNNWNEIKQSSYISARYKFIYTLFDMFPFVVSKFLSGFRRSNYKLLKRLT